MVLRNDTAMTGEISLQGYVLPVGGIKEKCQAAIRNKIKRVILPYENKWDIEDLPKETKENLEFIFVRNIKEVIPFYFDDNIDKNISKAKAKF
jgi:ATP-dependent Lon protease